MKWIPATTLTAALLATTACFGGPPPVLPDVGEEIVVTWLPEATTVVDE